ncbi:MAG TPA: hypothetical protein VI412_11620 [Tabrizicola sp.]
MTYSAKELLALPVAPDGIAARSVDFDWKGPQAHLAPTKATPLAKALMGKTNCGLYVLLADTLVWAARRLEFVAEIRPLLQMAEALLCYQDDPRYFAEDGPSHLTSPLPPAQEAVETLCYETSAIFMATPGRHASRPPIQAVENVVSVTRLVLGSDAVKPFRKWITDSVARLDSIAPNEHQDFRSRYDFGSVEDWEAYKTLNMGLPLPPDVLSLQETGAPSDLADGFARYLRSVEPATNPYLASAETMLAQGFMGTPYQPRTR